MITMQEVRLETLRQLAMISKHHYGMVSRVPLWAHWTDEAVSCVVSMQHRAYGDWQAAESRLRLAEVLYAPQQLVPVVTR